MKIKEENQTLATVTLQNYFRMYDKLAGMTGTAETEAAEFMGTYSLQVVPIPTHRPLARDDDTDLIFRTEEAKYQAVVERSRVPPGDGPARAGRHGVGREVRAARPRAREAWHPATRC